MRIPFRTPGLTPLSPLLTDWKVWASSGLMLGGVVVAARRGAQGAMRRWTGAMVALTGALVLVSRYLNARGKGDVPLPRAEAPAHVSETAQPTSEPDPAPRPATDLARAQQAGLSVFTAADGALAERGSRSNIDLGYAIFTFKDGTTAISLSPLTGTVTDALDALDEMEKRAPGFMARPVGVHVHNGRTRLLMEAFDAENTRWNEMSFSHFQPSERVLHRLQQVLTPETFERGRQRSLESPGETCWDFNLSRAFEHDYLFIGNDELPRMGLPVRVAQFKEAIPELFRTQAEPPDQPPPPVAEIVLSRLRRCDLDAKVQQVRTQAEEDVVPEVSHRLTDSDRLVLTLLATVAPFRTAEPFGQVHREASALWSRHPVPPSEALAFHERSAPLLGLSTSGGGGNP